MDVEENTIVVVKIDREEYSIIECKSCKQVKKRYYAGRYPNGKDKRWCDLDGRQWSGAVCSLCHAYRCAQKKRIQSKFKTAMNKGKSV